MGLWDQHGESKCLLPQSSMHPHPSPCLLPASSSCISMNVNVIPKWNQTRGRDQKYGNRLATLLDGCKTIYVA